MRIKFGLTLPNRGVITGATTVPEMLELARRADASGVWDSVWVGDSIFAKPRLDSLTLMAAIAAVTERVRIGPACFASTPLRDPRILAYQWCSLDLLSAGRTVFVACQGGPRQDGGRFYEEFANLGIEPASRMSRMEQAIEILRLVSSQEDVSYQGEHYSFKNLTVLPRPVQQPIPIWATANPYPDRPQQVESSLRRVARLGDGWMTTENTVESFGQHLGLIRAYAREEGRPLPEGFEACLYYNINVGADRERAFAEAKKFLDSYYMTSFSTEFLERWVALGSVEECVEHLLRFGEAGATTITLRLVGYDQEYQYRAVTEEVLPRALEAAGVPLQ
jgi:alkanesulfonate monooxygenase SsuD/methylene tetrahydromethanopterin reductase-like flavin-dependent oxidoreductase (luciferase family)